MWKKVIAPTILVILMWIAISIVTTFFIHWLYKVHTRVLTEDVATIRDAGAMQAILWKIQVVVTETRGKTYQETQNEISNFIESFQQHLDEAKKTSLTPQEQVLVKDIADNFAAYRDRVQNRLDTLERNKSLSAEPVENEKFMGLARAVAESCQELLEINESSLIESTTLSVQWGNIVNLLRFVFMIAGPVVGLLFGLWVARGLHRSISQISITLKDASGELDSEVGTVDVYTPNDLPALQQQVQIVARRIRQVVAELQQVRRKAMLAERLAAVGELAAEMAHELRNPLTAVKLLIQKTAQRPNTVLTEKQLQVIQHEIARMESTIQGLLDFSRPPTLHGVRHDLRETVRRALNIIADLAKQQNVIVTEEFPPLPVIVDGDPEQLHQVFVNLSLNSIEAMPDGGALHVALRNNGESDGFCRVLFRDSGNGIPREILARIFEPFRTTKERGTGLGLAICRRIIEEHNGSLLADNPESGGALFTVELQMSKTLTEGTLLVDDTLPQEKGIASLPLTPSASEPTNA
jgi:two-component system, NtrC family, sensor histidine kinase HydH